MKMEKEFFVYIKNSELSFFNKKETIVYTICIKIGQKKWEIKKTYSDFVSLFSEMKENKEFPIGLPILKKKRIFETESKKFQWRMLNLESICVFLFSQKEPLMFLIKNRSCFKFFEIKNFCIDKEEEKKILSENIQKIEEELSKNEGCLEILLQIVQNQKEIGIKMNNEVKYQSFLIDSLRKRNSELGETIKKNETKLKELSCEKI